MLITGSVARHDDRGHQTAAKSSVSSPSLAPRRALATVKNGVQRFELAEANHRPHRGIRLNERLTATNSELQAASTNSASRNTIRLRQRRLKTNFTSRSALATASINTFYPLIASTRRPLSTSAAAWSRPLISATTRNTSSSSPPGSRHRPRRLRARRSPQVFQSPQRPFEDEVTMLKNHPVYGQTLASFVDACLRRRDHPPITSDRRQGYPDASPAKAFHGRPAVLRSPSSTWRARCPSRDHRLDRQRVGKMFDPEAVRLSSSHADRELPHISARS